MARPSAFPDWATTLANDGTTGQPNRAEPSAGKKITGFNFNEKPPRQDVNWLFWCINEWIEYLDSLIFAQASVKINEELQLYYDGSNLLYGETYGDTDATTYEKPLAYGTSNLSKSKKVHSFVKHNGMETLDYSFSGLTNHQISGMFGCLFIGYVDAGGSVVTIVKDKKESTAYSGGPYTGTADISAVPDGSTIFVVEAIHIVPSTFTGVGDLITIGDVIITIS